MYEIYKIKTQKSWNTWTPQSNYFQTFSKDVFKQVLEFHITKMQFLPLPKRWFYQELDENYFNYKKKKKMKNDKKVLHITWCFQTNMILSFK